MSTRIAALAFAALVALALIELTRHAGAIQDSAQAAWISKYTRQPTFFEVATKHGTDKVTTHEYQYMYDKYLPAVRNQKKLKMLEIGLGCDMSYGPGASYHTWLEYFPHVDLYYLEYDAECAQKWAAATSDATIFTGDQADPEVLRKVILESGGNFDIIVEDGGHTMDQQRVSLEHLWSAVKPGGVYFLEDLQTSFLPHYGGDSMLGNEPNKKTMMKYIYEMLDDKMQPEVVGTKHAGLTADLRGIDCQREICAFFKKGGESSI